MARFHIFSVLFCLVPYLSWHLSNSLEFKYAQSAELATEIEKAFCTDKADHTVCNEPLGKICLGKVCQSVCSRLNLVACECNLGSLCNICCLNNTLCTSSVQLGLFDQKQREWFRQSKAQACLKTAAGYGPLCTQHEDGKICDSTFKDGSYVEEPWVCTAGDCVHVQCNIRHLYLYTCPCDGLYGDYPHCCRSWTNGTCLPFQWWLKTYAENGYHVGPADSGNYGGQNGYSGSRDNINPNPNPNPLPAPTPASNFLKTIDAVCIDQNDGMRCGLKSLCKEERCEHVCGGYGITECICAAGSQHECHVCCWMNGQCQTANHNPYTAPILRPMGTQCNYTYGSCDVTGSCRPIGSQHPAFQLCQDPANSGKACGFAQKCDQGNCVHVCGDEQKLCHCSPGSPEECHICCLRNDGACSTVNSNFGTLMLRPIGTQCNLTYGSCDQNGQCKALGNKHPNFEKCHDPDNDEKSCGHHKICIKSQCKHICGEESQSCRCNAQSSTQCHKCCLINGACVSANRGTEPEWIEPLGTACNFSFGACDHAGHCVGIGKTHPIADVCLAEDNEGKWCGENKKCKDKACTHICGDLSKSCRCAPGSKTECHKCCLENEVCTSINVHLDAPKDIEPIGTPCNFSYGICNSAGVCEPITHPEAAFCADQENDNKQCGPNRFCKEKQCKDVCETESCLCSPESRTECHHCCFDSDTGECRSANTNSNRSPVYRDFGSWCNFTFGTCNSAGVCESTGLRHPAAEFCDDPAKEGEVCGLAKRCSENKCAHVCGSEDSVCLCAPSTNSECHLCCLQDGACRSVFDSKSRDLLRVSGASCNFTLGSCDWNGICRPSHNHPSMQKCDYAENDGNQCDHRHKCKEFKCTHVCGDDEHECRCPPGSPQECHVCCHDSTGSCSSVFDGHKAYLMQTIGSPCNSSQGTCNEFGVCEHMATFCTRPENDRLQCGTTKQQCIEGVCAHVCGSEKKECVCEPGGPDECKMCCLKFKNNTCLAADPGPKTAFLNRPEGSSCNFTRGICIEGICDSVEDHPFYNFSQNIRLSVLLLFVAFSVICVNW